MVAVLCKAPTEEMAMPVKKLKSFLDDNGVKYTVISHSPAYTAQEIAASAHVSGKELAKTVVLKLDGQMALVVLPASSHVNMSHFKDESGAQQVELAAEDEFKSAFPDCEVGAMPPFGNLYDMAVFVDQQLSADEEIVFNAGSHTELIRLAYRDFEQLVQPTVIVM